MLYFAGYHYGADGAVMVTGSHNPPDYNGFKMMLGKKPFFGAQIQEIGRMAAEGDVVPVATEGTDRKVDVTEAYAARVLQDYDGGERKLKVVWDPGNGSGSDITKVLAASCRASISSSTAMSTAASRTTTPTRRSPRTSSS